MFIAAGMVGENWLKAALAAMALGLGLYFIPLGMVRHPALINIADAPFAALLAMAQIALDLAFVSHAIISPAPAPKRVALAVAAVAVWAVRPG